MKALSIHPYYAMAIVAGQKSIEMRTWKTDYRGDILICSTAKKLHGTIASHALGIVTLEDITTFKKKDCDAALLLPSEFEKMGGQAFAWHLTYNRLIKPVPVKGKLGLWEYDGEIEIIPDEEWVLQPGQNDQKPGEWVEKYWKPIMT